MFRQAEPALRYYASGLVNAVEGESSRAALIEAVREKVERIIRDEGALRVPKNSGAFVADR